jgi:DNA-binding transcriptional LysR family regulator
MSKDDTSLTQAAIRQNLGLGILPCCMRDSDPDLVRYCEPEPAWELGLWLLLHPDLRRTLRVLVFRDHMAEAIKAQKALFEGTSTNL